MDARILILNGKDEGSLIKVEDELIVGRSKQCQLRFVNPTVSRDHCRIFKESESYFIEDLGSMNGTCLNNKIISSKQVLKDGDLIYAACAQFKFLLHEVQQDSTKEL